MMRLAIVLAYFFWLHLAPAFLIFYYGEPLTMKLLIEYLAKRTKKTDYISRLLLGCVYGNLHLFGYLWTGRVILKITADNASALLRRR